MRVGRVPILANQHAGTEGTSSVDYRQVEVSSLRYSIEETAARPLIWNHFVAEHLLEPMLCSFLFLMARSSSSLLPSSI